MYNSKLLLPPEPFAPILITPSNTGAPTARTSKFSELLSALITEAAPQLVASFVVYADEMPNLR